MLCTDIGASEIGSSGKEGKLSILYMQLYSANKSFVVPLQRIHALC